MVSSCHLILVIYGLGELADPEQVQAGRVDLAQRTGSGSSAGGCRVHAVMVTGWPVTSHHQDPMTAG
jgi:phage tail tape-measure protein